jgi:hypothetical protein
MAVARNIIAFVTGGFVGAVVGGLLGLFGRVAFDHWVRLPLDFDYAAGLFGIAGAAVGALVGGLFGIWLAVVKTRSRLLGLMVMALLLSGGAGVLKLVLSPYWIATHWGSRAYLYKANLAHANLRGLDLSGANLAEADLTGADLREASLPAANLIGAKLGQADLRGAKLRSKLLVDAELEGADLTGARYDARTSWPSGFDPMQHGAVRER